MSDNNRLTNGNLEVPVPLPDKITLVPSKKRSAQTFVDTGEAESETHGVKEEEEGNISGVKTGHKHKNKKKRLRK